MQIGMGFYRWAQHYGWSVWPQHVDDVLAAGVQGGYAGFEGFIDIIDEAMVEHWRTVLTRNNIALTGLYTTAPLHDAALQDDTIAAIIMRARVARRLGATFVDANPLPIVERKTDAELEVETAGFRRLGLMLRAEPCLSEECIRSISHQEPDK